MEAMEASSSCALSFGGQMKDTLNTHSTCAKLGFACFTR